MAELDDSALKVLNGRHIAALATQNPDGSLHVAAVWYLYKDGDIYMTMNSATRKLRNAKALPKATVMVDTRVAGQEFGVVASGEVSVITGDEARKLSRQIFERYLTEKALADPEVGGFFTSFDDAVLRLSPRSWTKWDLEQIYTQFFGGKVSTKTGYLYPLD